MKSIIHMISVVALVLGSLNSVTSQPLSDILVLKNNDSIHCTIMEYDYEWVFVAESDSKDRITVRHYNSNRVRALLRNYGLEEEKLVFGEEYFRQELKSYVLSDSAGSQALKTVYYRNLEKSSNYLNEACTCAIIASGALIVGAAGGGLLLMKGSVPAGVLLFGISCGVSMSFGLAAGIKFKQAGRSLHAHTEQFRQMP